MKQELAKKLKDAGWRFEGRIEKGIKIDEEWVLLPTLSELIYACEDKFSSLQCNCPPYLDEEHWLKNHEKDTGSWSAYEYRATRGWKKGECRYENAKTPEEAVAKLWLRLNSKHDD